MSPKQHRRNLSIRLAVASTALVMVFLALALGGYYYWQVEQEEQQLDNQLVAEAEELLGLHAQSGSQELASAIRERLAKAAAEGQATQDHFYLYIESDTRVIAGNVAGWPAEAEVDGDGSAQTLTLDAKENADGTTTLLRHKARVRVEVLENGGKLLVGHDLEDSSNRRAHLRFGLMVGGLAVLLIAITTGLLMSRSLLSRLGQMNHTILRILAGNRHERMPYREHGDEFDELAHHFDKMLNENERLVSGMRAVTDDIAHDLRTPLSRVLNRIDLALRGDASQEKLRQTLEEIREETSAILGTFQELLLIAQIESGAVRQRMQEVDMEEVVSQAVDLYQPVAEEVGHSLVVATQSARVFGNPHLLAQVCTNLLDNAIKYTPPPGKIVVTLQAAEEGVFLSIADSGPGIPAQECQHVLERFVRLDQTRSMPGTGLGLSFVRAVAELHEAQLCLEDAEPGLRVVLRFPVRQEGQSA